ncbi:MAG: hypothetical protein ABIH39_01045 [Candidatus Margulisiibacteriota bacterium]
MKENIGNKNVVSCRTPHYDKIKIMADKKGTNVSAINREIIDLYFSLDFERADLILELVTAMKTGLKTIEGFSGLAEDVSQKFSSMKSAESYYFREINHKVDHLVEVILNVFGPPKENNQKEYDALVERLGINK